jgi:glycerol dehydrogenase
MARPASALRRFVAPGRYVQGPGAIDQLGPIVADGWRRCVVLVDEFLVPELWPRLDRSLAAAGVAAAMRAVSGEVTAERMQRLAARVPRRQADVVVAAGGGKTLDMGKGVASALGVRIVTVPTIASNDGPASRVIATYDEDHRLVATPTMAESPWAVVVDTELIAAAPVKYLLSGIGDALAKRFEAAACGRGHGMTSAGTRPLALAGYIADGCYDTLLRFAAEAVSSASRGTVTPALERVVEAVILMSGMAFENGGLSLAHSLTRGLLVTVGARQRLHGEHVAYGLLVQLQHEQDVTALAEVSEFLGELGMATSLEALGGTPDEETFAAIAAAALSAPHMANCQPRPSAESLTVALRAVEKHGHGELGPPADRAR